MKGYWIRLVSAGVVSAGLLFSAVMHALLGDWLMTVVQGGTALLFLLLAYLWFGETHRWRLPDWTRPFEVQWTPGGLQLVCNRCDTVVLPMIRRATQPRLLAYSHYHSTELCGRATEAAVEGEATAALSGPVRPWWRLGR